MFYHLKSAELLALIRIHERSRIDIELMGMLKNESKNTDDDEGSESGNNDGESFDLKWAIS